MRVHAKISITDATAVLSSTPHTTHQNQHRNHPADSRLLAFFWNVFVPQQTGYHSLTHSFSLQILVVLALLTRILSWPPALAGFAVTVALIPCSTWLARKQAGIRREVMLNTDKRVKLTSEVVAGMKAIKLYAWETPYIERISVYRQVGVC